MPHIGLGEIFVIAVAILIIFGPGKLPEIGKSLGKAVGEFRRGLRDGVSESDASKSDSSNTKSA